MLEVRAHGLKIVGDRDTNPAVSPSGRGAGSLVRVRLSSTLYNNALVPSLQTGPVTGWFLQGIVMGYRDGDIASSRGRTAPR